MNNGTMMSELTLQLARIGCNYNAVQMRIWFVHLLLPC
jgi:hypothetical protein